MYFKKYSKLFKEVDLNFSNDFLPQVSPSLHRMITEDIRKMELWKEIYD